MGDKGAGSDRGEEITKSKSGDLGKQTFDIGCHYRLKVAFNF